MKSVHLIGIGGTGMVALAGMFVEKGWRVSGTDQNVYPPASDELLRLNIRVFEGYRAENVSHQPDLVVVGNAIYRTNPEALASTRMGLQMMSMPEALRVHFISGRQSIVVAGTHGKSTTTSLLAWILESAGQSPGFFVGAIPNNFGKPCQIGHGKAFVVEGDEYDTAYFEKTPKFLHYAPHDVILTSIEFDHADIYRDVEHVTEQFQKLMRIIPSRGSLVAWGDSARVRDVVKRAQVDRTVLYGVGQDASARVRNVKATEEGSSFDVVFEGSTHHFRSPLLGEHNALNAAACAVMASLWNVSWDQIQNGIRTFRGVRRRQEFLGEARGVRIYDDFAHHPTAIQETLRAFRPMADARVGRLVAVFEPRSNTSRRRVFEKVMPESLSEADIVIIAPVYKKPDQLKDDDMLRPEEIAQGIQKLGRKALAPASYETIVGTIVETCQTGDVIVFMSNGNFGGLPRKILHDLGKNPANS